MHPSEALPTATHLGLSSNLKIFLFCSASQQKAVAVMKTCTHQESGWQETMEKGRGRSEIDTKLSRKSGQRFDCAEQPFIQPQEMRTVRMSLYGAILGGRHGVHVHLLYLVPREGIRGVGGETSEAVRENPRRNFHLPYPGAASFKAVEKCRAKGTARNCLKKDHVCIQR